MLPAELARFGLFIAVVALVYFLAAGILVRMALRRLGVLKTAPGRRTIVAQRVILGLASVGTICIAYGFFEPYWPEVTHHRIEVAGLPKGTRPIRIVHLSDIHSDPKPRLEERLPAIVARERPDLIVFTGDAINSPGGLPVFRRLMTRLAGIAPTYAVRGNWDVWYWPDLDLFGGTGVRELGGRSESIGLAGVPIRVVGVPVDSETRIAARPAGSPDPAVTVFLHHYPDEILDVAGPGVDLYCAGHIHGGQVALPFYGALITLSRFGKRYESGLYRERGTWMYVSRGIGMEGGRMPRVRFCARPEVAVLELVPPRSP